MGKIRIGCQTYTWEMLGRRWKGTVDDILDAMADAGFEGVEMAAPMIGPYYDAPDKFAQALEARKLTLAAFACPSPFGYSSARYAHKDLAATDRALAFAKHFPDVPVELSGGSSRSRRGYDRKFAVMCRTYNEIARRGAAMGVRVGFHPHSHHGSLIESADEYARALSRTDASILHLGPDTGHIVRSGNDLLGLLKQHITHIRHIHFKDVKPNGQWAMMGTGVCDFPGVLKLLEEAGYTGWVIAEEESDAAWKNPAGAIRKARECLRSLGY
ncbi:MAG: sugar phosphate isomerase/epimerase [Planctomycetes bacterium]|nr:sugar phosphate isomerase/epimerase [Planctomycetota bacterium]MBM4078809.1 sugar phosphate isomerase/epimerase [Planctomycetota bacterium]MBM4084087.1 sugar phosphate isomerase/epimerase [Planctomycetota bacterium]